MSGRPWIEEETRHQVGQAVAKARANRVGWKVLEALYRRERHTLARWARECTKKDEECTN